MTREPSLRKRLFLYPIIALVFAVFSVFIVYSAMGYQITIKDGKLSAVKTGLILLNTKPGDASVFLDGKIYKKKTPAFSLFTLKINKVSVGNHTIKIQRDGYEDWEGIFNVEPGLVSWGNYIIMLPKERKPESFDFSGEIVQTVSSPDKSRQMILLQNKTANAVSFWEVNLNNKEKRRVYEFYYKPEENYKLISYSSDNQRLMYEKKTGEISSIMVLDVTKESGSATNITSMFNIAMDKIVFNPKAHTELYGMRSGNLYNLNYIEKKMSAVLESNVSDVYAEQSGLFFVQAVEGNRGLWRLDSGGKTNLVKLLPASDSYQIAYLEEFEGYAVLAKKDKELYIQRTLQGKPTLKRIAENVDYFIVSPKSEYIGYKKEGSFYAHDIEREKCFTTLAGKDIKWISWFYDDENLVYGDGAGVRLVNYNGFYDKEIFKSEKLGGFSSSDSLNIFFFGKDENENTELYSFSFSG